MIDQFWKTRIKPWGFTSAASSYQILKLKCALLRSRVVNNSNNGRKIQMQWINILHIDGRSYPGWSMLPRFTVTMFLNKRLTFLQAWLKPDVNMSLNIAWKYLEKDEIMSFDMLDNVIKQGVNMSSNKA